MPKSGRRRPGRRSRWLFKQVPQWIQAITGVLALLGLGAGGGLFAAQATSDGHGLTAYIVTPRSQQRVSVNGVDVVGLIVGDLDDRSVWLDEIDDEGTHYMSAHIQLEPNGGFVVNTGGGGDAEHASIEVIITKKKNDAFFTSHAESTAGFSQLPSGAESATTVEVNVVP